ncbi:MAG: DnaJ domain-containing protein [Thermoanaerobaculia bacterium]|nr:DnaJ domain-containing protein [Thermoanaerobaculia bacterium]
MAKDYYSILAVSRNATQDQIRDRFRELARQRHPDRFQGEERVRAELDFQAITEAFNVLSSPERRRQHDVELSRPELGGGEGDAARLFRFHMEAGVQYYRDGNYFQASESFERATQADPRGHQAWHHLAQSLAQHRRYLAKAVAAIVRACELAPMNPAYLKLAGRLHAEAGQFEKAEQYYNEAVTWGGEDPVVAKALEELRKGSKKGWGGLFGRGG